jgi:hypothetical protein
VRIILAIGLLFVAVGFLLLALGPLSNLWGYKDSPISTYLMFGLPPLALCLAALVGAVLLIRSA